MKGSLSILDSFKVSPFFVFFIIQSLQIGVGVLGFQKSIVKGMGYDAWIAVLIAGFLIHIYLWLIYGIMNRARMDIVFLNQVLFGKWLGNLFNSILILYLFSLVFTVYRTYLEVVQVWMFPDLNLWVVSAFILPLIGFILKGGFRSIVGICFIGVVLPSFLVITIYFPLQYAHFGNLLPVGGFTFKELGISTQNMVFSYLGVEMTLFFYCFINEAKKSQKWAHLGNAVTIITYLVMSIISFAYFPEPYIKNAEWATLIMWKVVELPFLERFEYIGVTTWLWVVMPILCLYLWSVSRSIKHLFPALRQKTILYAGLLLMFLAVGFIETRAQISLLNTMVSRFGLYFLGSYIPLLYLLTLRRGKWRS